MAQPIEMKPPARDAMEEVGRRLNQAPLEHADAVLSAYQLLEQLHDTGTLDLLRGMLGAGDTVVNHAVQMVTQPEIVRGLRNLLILGRILGSINPDTLHGLVGEASQGGESHSEPPSLFALMRRMRSVESRRGLALTIGILEALGTTQIK
jgi:uncharacterized protein YjgD (DUF1641 family)